MSIARALHLGVLAAFLLATSLPTPSRADTLVPFNVVDGIIVFKLFVNGQGPFDFALDTGAADIVVTPDLARQLSLPETGIDVNGGAGASSQTDVRTSLDSVALNGLISARNVQATEVTLPEGLIHRAPGRTIRGLIGCLFLRRYVSTIDYAALTMRLASPASYVPPRDAVALPMTMVAGNRAPAIPVSIDGHRGTFWVDTGSSGWPDIKHSFARSTGMGSAYAASPMLVAQSVGGDDAEVSACLRRFSIGPWTETHVPTTIAHSDQGVMQWTDFDGIVGYETLREYRTIFDFTRSTLYLEPIRFLRTADYATTKACLPVRLGPKRRHALLR